MQQGKSSIVILRENILNVNELAKKVNERFKKDVLKKQVVGYVQRGGLPTKLELNNAVKFAKKAIEGILKGVSSKKVLMQNGKAVFVEPEVYRRKTKK